ncbi:capsid protein [Dipodfec virus UA04Rod_5684]|uniref:Capsid protein n=1 Tax=Dipodfec virus UA04Rod_5684 TaxID=2929251 RepID=A0A976R849_9VIRU|nr:capsid protein [Dipodfec virus UA04Rod_5684]
MIRRRRRVRKRPAYRRRYRRFYKRHLPRSRTSRMFVKLRLTRDIVKDEFSTRIAYLTIQPSPYRPFDTSVDTFAEWPSVQELYSHYRVAAIKIKVYPVVNIQSGSTVTTNPFQYLPVYVAYFPRSQLEVLTDRQLLENQYCKVFNQYRPWKYYTKIWRKTAGGADIRGYRPIVNPNTGDISAPGRIHILFSGQGAPPDPPINQVLYTLVLTFYIALKHRE